MNDTTEALAARGRTSRAPSARLGPIEAPTALLVLADGTVIEGKGAGAAGIAVGEVCFNTAMTGYQEILTDPSYAGQIITFTFPHIGNVGTNAEDLESGEPRRGGGVRGCVLRAPITRPSNCRAAQDLDAWLKARGIIAITGVDTRALDRADPRQGHAECGDRARGRRQVRPRRAEARGCRLARHGRARPRQGRDLGPELQLGRDRVALGREAMAARRAPRFHVVAIDYGLKRNILRELATAGCRLTVVPATATAEEILERKPDGVFLSNGPGDPAATGVYAVPEIRKLVVSGLPVFGICLGHQMLGLALGGKTGKMHQGHHGANHPVKDFTTGKVEITSMNHGFAVDRASLPPSVEETHVSLFDGSNAGLKLKGKPVFSVQYHPEASPGPQDSHYLFLRFVEMMKAKKGTSAAS